MKGDKAMENKKLQKVEGHDLVWTDGEKLYGRRFPEEESSNTTDTTNQNTDAKLRKVEGHDLVWTDGKKLYGRRFPDEENSNTTAEGERLIREAKKNYQEQTKRNDDNMINGDDGTKLSQTKQASSEDKDAIEIKRRNIEEVKKVTNEVTTNKNVYIFPSGVIDKKKPFGDYTLEETETVDKLYSAWKENTREYLKRQKGQQRD